MPDTTRPAQTDTLVSALLDAPDSTLVDLVDNLLDRGVVLDAELVLGLAGIDLVYVRLAALLCSIDRLERPGPRSGE